MQFLKINFCKFLGVLTLLMGQNILIAYTPANISGKYTIGTIAQGDFCYAYWMATTMASNYESKAGVRESFAPSATVDSNGDLYTISLLGFGTNDGPCFAIHKYVDGSLSKRITNFYPWATIEGVTPNCTSTPSFGATGVTQDENFFKDYIHNAFMPCLAQEVNGGSDYIYGFIYIPPTRYMRATCTHPGRENGSTEGMLFFKLKKNGLSDLVTKYTPHTTCRMFQFDRLFPRTLNHDKESEKEPEKNTTRQSNLILEILRLVIIQKPKGYICIIRHNQMQRTLTMQKKVHLIFANPSLLKVECITKLQTIVRVL